MSGPPHREDGDDASTDPELPINDNISKETLLNLYRDSQRAYNDLWREDTALKRSFASVTNEVRDKRQRISTDASESDEDDNISREVQLLARKFTSTAMVWLREHDRTFRTSIEPNYDAVKRFKGKDTASKIQGQIHDILDLLPGEYHDMRKNAFMRKTFSVHMQTQRSNMATRVRHACGTSIFSCSDSVMVDPAQRKVKFQELIGWDNEKSVYHHWNCPVLHKNGQGWFDMSNVFLSEMLFRCFAAIFFGPSAVSALLANKNVGRGKESVAGKWGMTHATPGSIACAAIMTRWAVSADVEFRELGKQTGIDWQADFESYLAFLINGARNNKKSVLNIFQQFNDVFFPGLEDETVGPRSRRQRNSREDQDTAVMDALNNDEEIIDESTGGQDDGDGDGR
ncbi:hypothetical protein VKT23_010657 [Stygiomarasmius scandens]|uniref:HNH nuclease domain-containing protein n=1 Tax=Marasmiellus scandens TaxID=2682957 RepID=A0ABR1JFN6_9AGAR